MAQAKLAHRLSRAVLAAVGTAIPLAALGLMVRSEVGPVIRLDRAAISAATTVTRSHPGFRDVLVVWQEVFQPWHLYIPATLLCVQVWRRHGLRSRAAWAFITMMAGWNIGLLVKVAVRRARPILDDAVAHAPGYSFPSGHVTNLTIIAGVVLVLLRPVMTRGQFRAGVGVAVVLVVLTALDRVFLGVHFPSDTVAGAVLGLGIALASYRGYLDWNRAPGRVPERGVA